MDEEDKKEIEICKLESVSSTCTDTERRRNREISHDFGLCNKCSYFMFTEYELGDFAAYCRPVYGYILFKRDAKQKVIKCNSFSDRGTASVRELYDMATLIDTREKVGFRS
jgi:hypothetical protein